MGSQDPGLVFCSKWISPLGGRLKRSWAASTFVCGSRLTVDWDTNSRSRDSDQHQRD